MNDEQEIIKRYYENKIKEQEEELLKNASLIENFITYCKSKKIELSKTNFKYIETIGIVAKFPNIVHLLNNNIKEDKEALISLKTLKTEFETRSVSGYLYSENYIVMAHPYFRRGYHENSNFSPRFIDVFSHYNKKENEKYIAIDKDRVRINVDNIMYFESDTWFGAKFKNKISDIDDGIVKLRLPHGLEPFEIDFFCGSTYSLDIKWSSKEGIKVFQAEEFKVETQKIKIDGNEYYPVKYIHSEFDIKVGAFRHFDGAIHFYTKDEYFKRRDEDFNYNNKNNFKLKTLSKKLFKINGQIETIDWVNLVSHYLTGNPLIIEYFEGKLPTDLIDTIEKLIAHRQKEKNKGVS